jgi:hypothetical protein
VRNIKSAIATSTLFLIVLLCWGFAAPIGAGADADFHLSSIWCGQGERPGLCEERQDAGWYVQAKVPFMFQMCDGRPIEYQPTCPTIESEPAMQFLRTAPPQQVNNYYRAMSVFASQNTNQSVLIIRSVNALIASAVLCGLLLVSRGKTRLAIAASWTIGLIPVAVQNFSSVNPRGWSYLAVFATWGFLASALEAPPRSSRSYYAYLLGLLSAFLAFATRIDGSLYVLFSCAVITACFTLRSYVISKKQLYVSAAVLIGIALAIRSIPRISRVFTFELPSGIALPRYLLLHLVQGPEFIAQAWGYNVGQQGNGPGIIGVIGLSLFAITLAFSLKKANPIQIVGVTTIAVFIASAQLRGSIAIGELTPSSGEYVMSLTVFLLGFSIWTSASQQMLQISRSGRIGVIALLTFSHAVALYSYMEFYVKRGSELGTFKTISLQQQWWWNSGISPNFVFWIACFAFAAFLYSIWETVISPVQDEQ